MAKSSRSSSSKNNAHRRAMNINGPVEQARAERLSAKLVELANAPKPESSDVNMEALTEDVEKKDSTAADETTMDVDAAPSKARTDRKRIAKRKVSKKGGIVFKKARVNKSSQQKRKGKEVSK